MSDPKQSLLGWISIMTERRTNSANGKEWHLQRGCNSYRKKNGFILHREPLYMSQQQSFAWKIGQKCNIIYSYIALNIENIKICRLFFFSDVHTTHHNRKLVLNFKRNRKLKKNSLVTLLRLFCCKFYFKVLQWQRKCHVFTWKWISTNQHLFVTGTRFTLWNLYLFVSNRSFPRGCVFYDWNHFFFLSGIKNKIWAYI